MWFFGRRKRIIEKIIDIPMPILIRNAIYDSIFEDAEKIAVKMGLPPISEDVSDMERKASEERMAQFSELIPFIDAHTDVAARVAQAAYAIQMEKESGTPVDETEEDEITNLFKLVALSSTVSCISILMDLGLLDTDVVPRDEEEDYE